MKPSYKEVQNASLYIGILKKNNSASTKAENSIYHAQSPKCNIQCMCIILPDALLDTRVCALRAQFVFPTLCSLFHSKEEWEEILSRPVSVRIGPLQVHAVLIGNRTPAKLYTFNTSNLLK